MKVAVSFLIIFAMFGTVYAQEYPELGVKVEVVAENLKVPWAIDFAPDGRMFFTERVGKIIKKDTATFMISAESFLLK